MARLNWRRGLFRFWLVAALTWIGFATWVFDPMAEARKLQEDPIFLVPAINHEIQFEAGTEPAVVKKVVARLVDEGKMWDKGDIPDPWPKPSQKAQAEADRIVGSYEPKTWWGVIVRPLAFMALVPPLVVLGVGLILGWIGRGFRPA